MKAPLLLALAIALLSPLCGAGAAQYPENEQPMYGGAVQPEAQSMRFASDQAVFFGWHHLGEDDDAAAMRRFNQAWSLNPKNAEALWGMGTVMLRRANREAPAENLRQAVGLMRQAQALEPQNSRLLADFANTLAAQAAFLKAQGQKGDQTRQQDSEALYAEAEQYFTQSLELEPDYPPTVANYAVFKFHTGDYPAAQAYVEKAEALGYPVAQDFKRKLAEKQ